MNRHTRQRLYDELDAYLAFFAIVDEPDNTDAYARARDDAHDAWRRAQHDTEATAHGNA